MREYYKIAIYMRISKQDREKKYSLSYSSQSRESASIYMQKMLLKNYVKSHFVKYKLLEFQDDGYTGTNLDRPGIQSLLELVRSLEIDCIIVKDFSRFSRDYIELGIYIEQIFPFMGVRFISINDSFDSEEQKWNGGNIEHSFQYLLCDLYSKDLSVKIRSSLETRSTQGMYVSANSPFGYIKSSNNRHIVLVAEDEAAIVRRIFSMKMEGITSSQIAKIFNQQKVKTPIEFKIEKGLTSRKPKGEKFQWTNSSICQILNNEFYVGDLVYGKYQKDSVGGRNHLKSREEWKIIRNHHEPIIDRKQFALVQRKRGKRINNIRERNHVLVGKLICGSCSRNLIYRSCTKNPYFYCNSRYVNEKKECVKKVNAMLLEQMILILLELEIRKFANMDRIYKEYKRVAYIRLSEFEKEKQKLKRRLSRLQQQKQIRYEKYVQSGKKNSNQKELSAIAEQIYELEKQIIKIESEYETKKKSISLQNLYISEENIKKNKEKRGNTSISIEFTKLTQKILDTFLKKISITDENYIQIEWSFCVNEFASALL